MSDTVVEGTLARPDNHAEERPNRAAADPSRVNPALCTYEDAAQHLRPVRGPHGEPASPLRCGSSEGLEKSIRASTGAAQRAQPSSQGVVYGSAAQVRGRSKHLGHVGTAQAAGRAHGAALHGRDGGALAPAAAIWETLGRVLEKSWQSLGRPVFSRVNSNTVILYCTCNTVLDCP